MNLNFPPSNRHANQTNRHDILTGMQEYVIESTYIAECLNRQSPGTFYQPNSPHSYPVARTRLVSMASSPTIPVVDFSHFYSQDPAHRLKAGTAIFEAMRDIGFLYLINHGVSEDLIQESFAQVGLLSNITMMGSVADCLISPESRVLRPFSRRQAQGTTPPGIMESARVLPGWSRECFTVPRCTQHGVDIRKYCCQRS